MLVLGLTMLLFSDFKDVHTFGNTDEVLVDHVSLDLHLDFERQVIDGKVVLSLKHVARKKKAEYVDLDTKDLHIQKVLDPGSGDELRFEMGPETNFMGRRLRVFLPSPLDKIEIFYETDPKAGALQWLDPAQTTSKKHPFLFTQSQAILARTWIPLMDSPGVRVTYDAVIRLPKELTAVMSAVHREHEPEKGIYRFGLDLAIPPYLIALAAGELEFKAIGDRAGVYAEPGVVEKAAWEFADMEKMIRAAEALYGKYRWKRWDAIVLPPSFPFGGMENPLLTFATPTLLAGDRSLVAVMAHELAHSWSGNLVTNATWSDFWLNEGFTTYFERRIVEKLYGKEVAEMQWWLGQRDLKNEIDDFMAGKPEYSKLHQDLEGEDPDDAFSGVPYDKGANFLLVLENHFGREKFDAFLKSYFNDYAFQNMTTQRFLDLLLKKLFENDLQAWKDLKVDEWVFEPGLPANLPKVESKRIQQSKDAAALFVEKGDLSKVEKDKWITDDWLLFMAALPDSLSQDQMKALDEAFAFSKSGNSEVLFAWLIHAVRNNYEPAYDELRSFLTRQGRRKFLKPLYQEMMDNAKTRKMAKDIYDSARSGYHPISVNTIDGIVRKEG